MLARPVAFVLLSICVPFQSPAPTAGDVVLLATRPLNEGERDLRAALSHQSPRLRAAAARVIAVSDDGRFAADVARALRAEQAPETGAELIRALLVGQGPSARGLAEEHAMRIGGAAISVLLDWTARRQPRDLGRLLPQATARRAPTPSIIAAVSLASRDASATVDVLRGWLPVAPPGAWHAALQNALTSSADLRRAEPVILDALQSPNPVIRDETVWALLAFLSMDDTRLSPALLQAVQPHGDRQVDWEQFGRELIARQATRLEMPDRTAFLKGEQSLIRLFDIQPHKLLTASELAAVVGRAPTKPPTGPSLKLPRDHGTRDVSARTVALWMPGLLDEVLRSAGCGGYRDLVGTARVTFRDDGRPRKVELEVGRVPKPCVPVLHALALTTFAEEGRRIRENVAQTHVLPFGGTFSRCQPVSAAAASLAVPPPLLRPLAVALVSKLSSPKRPIPGEVVKKGRPGDTVMEVTIGEKGCVSAVQVLNDPGNDPSEVFAIQEVLDWTYAPLVIGGKPHVFRTHDVLSYSWQVKLR